MIELQQLRQLIAVAKYGTVSNAANALFISQPALSRSLQKLEEDLGVELFTRQTNKLELNENGRLAVEYAQKLLGDFDSYIENIRAFDKSRRTISVGVCAPAPLWTLLPALNETYPGKTVSSEIKNTADLTAGLLDGAYQIIITDKKTELPGCVSAEFCREQLQLCVPVGHELAARSEISFADFDGAAMLLYEAIGSWMKIKALLPHTRFIVQNDRDNFNDLVHESTLLCFSTNLAASLFGTPPGRINIPITDASATKIFYITALKKNKHLLAHL